MKCPDCRGTGAVTHGDGFTGDCMTCEGAGDVTQRAILWFLRTHSGALTPHARDAWMLAATMIEDGCAERWWLKEHG